MKLSAEQVVEIIEEFKEYIESDLKRDEERNFQSGISTLNRELSIVNCILMTIKFREKIEVKK
jgi:hypothetical protein